jgi:hypothetical protein
MSGTPPRSPPRTTRRVTPLQSNRRGLGDIVNSFIAYDHAFSGELNLERPVYKATDIRKIRDRFCYHHKQKRQSPARYNDLVQRASDVVRKYELEQVTLLPQGRSPSTISLPDTLDFTEAAPSTQPIETPAPQPIETPVEPPRQLTMSAPTLPALTAPPNDAPVPSLDNSTLYVFADDKTHIHRGVTVFGPYRGEITTDGKQWRVQKYGVIVDVRCFDDGDLARASWLDDRTLEITQPNFSTYIRKYLDPVATNHVDAQAQTAFKEMMMAVRVKEKKSRVVFPRAMAQMAPDQAFPVLKIADTDLNRCTTCTRRPYKDMPREIVYTCTELEKVAIGEDTVTRLSEQVRELEVG